MFVLGADGNAGSARIVCITPADRIVLTTQLRFDPAERACSGYSSRQRTGLSPAISWTREESCHRDDSVVNM